MRDLQKCIDNTGNQWAKDLRKLLSLTNMNRKNLLEQGIDSFDEATEAEFYFKLDQALSLGYQEWQQPGNSYYALMEHTLIKRIVTYTPQYFALPFSNNLSERSLRGVKSKMKVAGQFENITSSKNYATSRSIETSYRNEKNPTKALEKLMASKPYQVKELLQK